MPPGGSFAAAALLVDLCQWAMSDAHLSNQLAETTAQELAVQCLFYGCARGLETIAKGSPEAA
jgi:hypothetical protein